MNARRMMKIGFGALAAAVLTQTAAGQFGVPASTPVRERVVGVVISDEGFPVPEAGDQIGAFDGTLLVGRFVFGTDSGTGDDALGPTEFDILIFGDNPTTSSQDGARQEAVISFKFFDAGTETETNMRVQNGSGERAVYRYRGEEVPPIDFLPIDLTPTRSFNLRLTDSAGGGDGGGGDGETDDFDVNGDGAINNDDVVLVLRAVSGGEMTMTDDQLARADVNGDNIVSTQDAILIMRNK